MALELGWAAQLKGLLMDPLYGGDHAPRPKLPPIWFSHLRLATLLSVQTTCLPPSSPALGIPGCSASFCITWWCRTIMSPATWISPEGG